MPHTDQVKSADTQISVLRDVIEPVKDMNLLGREAGVEGATPFTTEGPYYIPFEERLNRKDITEDREGVPLTLRIGVVNAATREPIPGALVEVWHCDAHGWYSGHLGDDPDSALPTTHQEAADDSRFLRGGQNADDAGVVEFETIYPGWYNTRAVHIHAKVTIEGSEVFTGHIFLPDEYNEVIEGLSPYREHATLERVPNEMDLVHEEAHGDDATAAVEYVNPGEPQDGFRAALTLAVVPGEKDFAWSHMGRA